MLSSYQLHLCKPRCSPTSGVQVRVAQGSWPRLGVWGLGLQPTKLLSVNQAAPTRDQAVGAKDQPLFLSDIIAFQSSTGLSDEKVSPATAKADEIIEHATQVLEAARAVLASEKSSPPPEAKRLIREPPPRAKPSTNRFTVESVNRTTIQAENLASPPRSELNEQDPASTSGSSADERKRKILQSALDGVQPSSTWDDVGSNNSPVATPGEKVQTASWTPDWAQGLLSGSAPFGSMVLQPAKDVKGAGLGRVAFADPDALPSVFDLALQSQDDTERARQTELPPLQSLLELTSAFRPPTRSGATASVSEDDIVTTMTQQAKDLADGKMVLADGTIFEKLSGDEIGENGYWRRWHLIRGLTVDSKVAWEESWYETSDWFGLKEMGADKSGTAMDGSSWKESWSEKIYYQPNTLEPVVERTAHKWAHDALGDEWEENWNEYFSATGRVTKSADKWGKQGPNVWHESWGEDYNGGGACVKWTDRWAERVVAGGDRIQWGDKWKESFDAGHGYKTGEVWNVEAGGNRYNRYWGEDHYGNGSVRRHGHSTSGEQWDFTESADTYYNPIPHFGFKHAISHSPQLAGISVLPKDDPQGRYGGLGPGLDDL